MQLSNNKRWTYWSHSYIYVNVIMQMKLLTEGGQIFLSFSNLRDETNKIKKFLERCLGGAIS